MLSRTFLSSSFWITARYGFTALAGLLVTFAFARLATKETLGQYQFVVSLIALFSFFSLPGLNMATLKEVANKRPGAVIETVRRSFRSSLYAVPLLLVYAGYLWFSGDRSLGLTVALAGLLSPFFFAPQTWYTYYEGRANFRPVAIRAIIASFGVSGAVILALVFKLSSLWITTIYFLVSTLFFSYFYFQVRREILEKATSIAHSLDIAYGHRVNAQKFVYVLSENLPPLAVSFLFGHAALAGFQIANVFLIGVSSLISALAAMSIPALFRNAEAHHRSLFKQNSFIGLLASLGYWLIVNLVFLPMYGEKYHESFLLAQLFTGIPLLISIRTFLVHYFTTKDRNRLIMSTYITANSVALLVFFSAARLTPFTTAASLYLYTLNLSLLLPLLWEYVRHTKPAKLTSTP